MSIDEEVRDAERRFDASPDDDDVQKALLGAWASSGKLFDDEDGRKIFSFGDWYDRAIGKLSRRLNRCVLKATLELSKTSALTGAFEFPSSELKVSRVLGSRGPGIDIDVGEFLVSDESELGAIFRDSPTFTHVTSWGDPPVTCEICGSCVDDRCEYDGADRRQHHGFCRGLSEFLLGEEDGTVLCRACFRGALFRSVELEDGTAFGPIIPPGDVVRADRLVEGFLAGLERRLSRFPGLRGESPWRVSRNPYSVVPARAWSFGAGWMQVRVRLESGLDARLAGILLARFAD